MRLNSSKLVMALILCTGPVLIQPPASIAGATGSRVYYPPTGARLEQAEQLFNWLFDRQSLDAAGTIAAELGFSWSENATEITLLDEEKRGWGDYRFSKQGGEGVALQAPHRYHDKHTGTIVRQLFELGGFDSIALNSLSRRTPQYPGSSITADLARLPDSFHTAYSTAFAVRYPHGTLIQIHGFSAAKRRSPEARQTSMILSTGSSQSTAYLHDLQRCFNRQGWHSLLYPRQVNELGATRNSIGATLRRLGHGGFTHIELNLETRKQLVSDREKLKSFAGCLLEPAQ